MRATAKDAQLARGTPHTVGSPLDANRSCSQRSSFVSEPVTVKLPVHGIGLGVRGRGVWVGLRVGGIGVDEGVVGDEVGIGDVVAVGVVHATCSSSTVRAYLAQVWYGSVPVTTTS